MRLHQGSRLLSSRLLCNYLERADLTEAESSERKLRLTFHVADQLAALQYKITTNRSASLKPSRKVTLVIDPKRKFAVIERDEWNIVGKHTTHTTCDEWKYYEKAAIWLPSRCVESCFARPRTFMSEYSDEPIHTATLPLTEAVFETQKISFSFKRAEGSPDIFARDDPIPASARETEDPLLEKIKAQARDYSQVMETASRLTDMYGPRLTGSERTKAAGEWAVAKLRSWGNLQCAAGNVGPIRESRVGERALHLPGARAGTLQH